MIDPQSIINVFKSLKISPKATVCILDGGMNYGYLNEDEIKKSNFLKNSIRTEISNTHQIYNISNDVDIDYFLCSYAPILITGPGSFAITAAIANQHGIIRTPSCKNTNFCEKEGKSVQKIIHKNWVTYDYTLLDINNIQEDYTLVNDLENTENPYNTGSKLLWPNNDEEFLKNNFPNTFDFDKEIKQDIINRGRELPLNSAIIDCGAHIGDGAIPIAGALKSIGREDITVYAIDPGLEKIEFITEMRNKII